MSDDSLRVEEFRGLYNSMSPTERWEAHQFMLACLTKQSRAALAELVRRLPPELRASFSPSEKEIQQMMEELGQRHAEQQEMVVKAIRKFDKWKRGRKPLPKNVTRNINICDLHWRNPKVYSCQRLADDFGVTRQRIQQILNDEPKWRGLASN
jgi:hypothetical protein